MTKPAAIQGDYVDLRFVKGRKVCQLVVEFPIEAGSELVRQFGTPLPDQTVPVAVARMNVGNGSEHPEIKERRRMDELPYPQQAALLCKDMRFTKFLEETGVLERADDIEGLSPEQETATAVRKYCDINSRAQFATNQYAAQKWRDLFADYEAWKEAA